MAGSCVGPGLVDGADGIQLYGPRSAAWAVIGPGCGVDQINGIRVDPVTEKLWTPPDAQILATKATGLPKVIVPTFVHDTALTTLTLSIAAFSCRVTMVVCQLGTGVAQFRIGPNNQWLITQDTQARINNIVTTTPFGKAFSQGFENHSTGLMGAGISTPAVNGVYLINPGDTLTLRATFTHKVVTYGNNFANQMSWTPPDLFATSFSKPLP